MTTDIRSAFVRALDLSLELTLGLIVVGSVLAVGSVEPWGYLPAGVAIGAALLMLGLRALTGPRPVAADEQLPSRGEPARLAPGPLFLPGLVFAMGVLLQLVPWPPRHAPLTLSPEATARGLGFLSAALALHQLAMAVFAARGARRRFRGLLAVLGVALALVALLQLALGTTRIYGLYPPREAARPFGPFVNRNHFAGYFLMVVPITLGLLASAWRRLEARVEASRGSGRRWLLLQSPEAADLLRAALPPFVATAALVASVSRGALVAFVAALGLTALALRRRSVPAWALAVAFLAVSSSWFGFETVERRVAQAGADAPGRLLVWRDALSRMDGRWLTGTGFNTFGFAMGRVAAWTLPDGATPWPEGVGASFASGARLGYRALADLPGRHWYREAHDDYLQLLVETGIPGLLVALWAGARLLARARSEPWLLCALAGVLLHELVDFDLQIPASAWLFVTLAALAARSAGARRGSLAHGQSARRSDRDRSSRSSARRRGGL